MKIKNVFVKNFKAISGINAGGGYKNGGKGEKIELNDVTIIVGPNSSGKSSLLQALHWAARCVAHEGILRNQNRSISPLKLDYFPTIDVKRVGNTQDLRAQRGETPEVMTEVSFHVDVGGEETYAVIPIRRGNNDSVQISPDIENKDLYDSLKNKTFPFTAYIPGLAGISSLEEKNSRLPVFRKAASGDANIVLRNILELISTSDEAETTLDELSVWVSKVLGETKIFVQFNQDVHFDIKVEIQTNQMKSTNRWAPLELAGTGVLQVIQIFAYLILFRPKLLLIDEPDSHLHPDRQEALIRVLEEASHKFNAQIILTTHSPNVVRAKGPQTRLVWMRDGEVQTAEDKTIKRLMGWGGLDKQILLFVEDEIQADILRLLSQWPSLSAQVAVCSAGGVEKLPSSTLLKGLIDGAALKMKIIIHRDRDFMTDDEADKWSADYIRDGYSVWITELCDVEHYFTAKSYLARSYEITDDDADALLTEAYNLMRDEAAIKFANKRRELVRLGIAESEKSEALLRQMKEISYRHCTLGKHLRKKLRKVITDRRLDVTKLDRVSENPSPELTLAPDLKAVIELALATPAA